MCFRDRGFWPSMGMSGDEAELQAKLEEKIFLDEVERRKGKKKGKKKKRCICRELTQELTEKPGRDKWVECKGRKSPPCQSRALFLPDTRRTSPPHCCQPECRWGGQLGKPASLLPIVKHSRFDPCVYDGAAASDEQLEEMYGGILPDDYDAVLGSRKWNSSQVRLSAGVKVKRFISKEPEIVEPAEYKGMPLSTFRKKFILPGMSQRRLFETEGEVYMDSSRPNIGGNNPLNNMLADWEVLKDLNALFKQP